MFNAFHAEHQPNAMDQIQQPKKEKKYKYMSRDLELPDVTAGCTTLEYLQRVENGEAFRITRAELMMFESALTEEDRQLSPFFTVSAYLPKLEMLMTMQGMQAFLFPTGKNPNSQWFIRVGKRELIKLGGLIGEMCLECFERLCPIATYRTSCQVECYLSLM